MKMRNKFFLCMALILSTLLSGCASNPTGIMDDGASRFSAGKQEEDYSLEASGDLLDELMDKYAGSYHLPSGTPMTDDEYEKLREDREENKEDQEEDTEDTGEGEEPEPSPGAPEEEKLPEVSSSTQLQDLMQKAYSEPTDYVEFLAVGGYTPDLSEELNDTYLKIQRKDPLVSGFLDGWQWYTMGNEYVIQIFYYFSMDEMELYRAEANRLVQQVAQELDQPGMSDYDKVVAVNQYLCDTVYYPPTEPYAPVTHTAYGTLINGCAVCEGYACSAAAILREMGVECDIEVGFCKNGGGHAWNLVKLEGSWYQLDVTWNDGGGTMDYFLVTDAFMRQSRDWDAGNYPATPSQPYAA